MTSLSTASRLVAAEEGYIGGSSGDGEMATDSPAGECPGEPNHSQTHLPLPRYHYDMTMSRDQDQPMHLNSDRMYHGDDQFGYEGIPYPLGINSRWYDPSARGSDVCYGPYHPQYILPPPFATHHYLGYTNNPIIHWQPPTRGPAHYTNAPLPFHSVHNADYANPSGGCELPAGPYRHAEVYGPKQPDAAAFPDTRGGTEHSMGTTVTSLSVTPDPSDLAGNIPSTSDDSCINGSYGMFTPTFMSPSSTAACEL
ncbi:hypothetical protein EDC04DRAFT_2913640 [Pisolithus marmoratus]|nr:hypothetical protein EDC04DRAFT_2913640 [Pisolithus marmoratus]